MTAPEPQTDDAFPQSQTGSDDAARSDAQHDYTSTACQHGHHDQCRLTCKFCGTPCRWPGHQTRVSPLGHPVEVTE